MKKLTFLLMVLMAATVVQAVAPVFEEDWTGQTKQVNTTTYGATIGDNPAAGSYNTWYMGANGIMSGAVDGMTGEFAQVQGIDAGRSRSAAIAIDGSGIPAGEYRLQWNFNMYGNATQSAQVWDVDASAGGFYTVKYADPTPVGQVVTDGSLATADLLAQWTYFHPAGAGALTGAGSLDFAYDGTGDIGLQFTISSDATWGWKPLLNLDDISIEKIRATAQSVAPTGTDLPQGLVALTWIDPDIAPVDPNVLSVDQYDVYYYPRLTANITDEDPNWADPGVVSAIDTTSGAVSFTTEFDTTYFCRVDTTCTWDVNDVYPTNESVLSKTWSFSVEPADLAPTVTTTYDGVITWDAELPVTLTAAVDDDGEGDISLGGISWTVTGHGSGDPSLLPLATLTDTTVDPLSPSATFTVNTAADPNAYGYWYVELEVADAALQTGTDTTYVVVTEDACEARKEVWDWQYVRKDGDLDVNCVVDILDLAALAADWLDDVKLENTFYYFN